jgi:ElaB/YqjD/DUF883 family membrane-anchored ribosome-binding protein
MKRASQAVMNETRARYRQMMSAMRRAENTMEPVLEAFQDQVLYLKHNLNARAIGSLRNELSSIERDTDRLVEEMQKAISEADTFIQSMK